MRTNFFLPRRQRSSFPQTSSSSSRVFRKPSPSRPVASLPRRHYLFLKNGTIPLALEDLTVVRKSVFDESKISIPSETESNTIEKQTKKGKKLVPWKPPVLEEKPKVSEPEKMITKILSSEPLSSEPSLSSNLISVLKQKAIAYSQTGVNPDLMEKIKKSIENFPGLERQKRLEELENCTFNSVQSLIANNLASVENFNSLIRVLGHQNSSPEPLAAFQVLDKMIELGFEPNQETFVSLILVSKNNSQLARSAYLRMRSLLISPNEKIYGALIKAHVLDGDISSGFALLRKMEDEHLTPSVVIYTILIDGLISAKKLALAWEIFRDARTWKNIQPDAVLFSVMIKSCIPKSECEKALNVLDDMRTSGEYPTDITYAHLIECMSSRCDFAPKAFEFYTQMKAEGFPLNLIVAKSLVRACGQIGDLEKLRKIIKEVSEKGFLLDADIYANMISCIGNSFAENAPSYESASKIRLAWYVLADMREKGLVVSTPILNAITRVYTRADQVDNAVAMLSLFSHFNCEPTIESYELLLEYFGFHKRDSGRFFALFDQCVSSEIDLGEKMFNLALDVAIESQSSSRTVAVLEQMFERKIFPLPAQAEKLAIVGRKIVQIHQVIGKLVAIQRDDTHDKMVRDNALVQLQIEEHATRLAAIEGKTMKDPTIEQEVRQIYFERSFSSVHKPPRLRKSEHLQIKKKGGEMHARKIDKPKHNILAE